MRRALLALVVAATGGCYDPTIADGQYVCNSSNRCPSGFKCSTCHVCIHEGSPDPGNCVEVPPCTNGNAVLNLGDVAFCPAAWLYPGVASSASPSTYLPCNRRPRADGRGTGNGGADVNCSVADNCRAGWHVCEDETDLAGRMLTQSQCMNSPAGFWATRQSSLAGSCADSGSALVLGCGGAGVGMGTMGCMLLDRAFGTADCAASTGAWGCGDATVADKVSFLLVKTQAADQNGGILCCRDPVNQ